MKPTAVEFAVEQLEQLIPSGHQLAIRAILEQALEMEKQQIIDAGNTCAFLQHIHEDKVNKMSLEEREKYAEEDVITCGEQYYNETFNSATPWYDENQTTERMNIVGQNGNDGNHYSK